LEALDCRRTFCPVTNSDLYSCSSKFWKACSSYASALHKVRDFSSTIVYTLVQRRTWCFIFAVVQCGILTVCGRIPTWRTANIRSFCCPPVWGIPWWEILKKVHKNQLCILTHTASLSQPTQFSDFQLNEANSSNQSTVAPSDFPTVSPHEPSPSTSATPTASTDRTVKAESTAFRFRTRDK
jgi:hypothetical protein